MGKRWAETGCKDEIMGRVPPGDLRGMRYYPAFDAKSGLDARFRRWNQGVTSLPRPSALFD
jgi:hypothetical protein